MKKIFPLIVFLFLSANCFAQYLTEDFEAGWAGSPAAPPGWTQSQVVLIGDGVPEAISVTGEKDWEQNTWTGAAWSKVPAIPGITPSAGAQSGTGVLWMNDNYFATTVNSQGSRRVESPTMNLSASVSPYVRFYLFSGQLSTNSNLRVVASSDNGVTWKSIMVVIQNADVTTFAATTPWQRINVLIPAAYRTANCKIGFEFAASGNTTTSQTVFIDNLTVAEFTPTTITSLATGNWSAGATWVGGVVPTADNNVLIAPGTVVSADVNAVRMQNLTVGGTFQYAAITASQIVEVFGDLTVSVGGTLNSWFSTTGKRIYFGGSINNAGNLDFSVGAGLIVWCGGAPATFTNTGTIVGGRVSNIWHYNSGGVTYNSPVTDANVCDIGNGVVNPNGNLTLGSVAYALTQTIERTSLGSFSSAPLLGAGVTRSITYLSANIAPYTKTVFSPGFEVETIAGERTIPGTLTMTMYDNLNLTFPLNVGTLNSGALTMTRGIIISSAANPLILSASVSGSVGTAPSAATPPITHGSYVFGPVKIKFPSNGVTTARNIPLGYGSAFNGSTPNINQLRTVTYTSGIPWTGSVITTSITASAPSGAVNGPLTSVMGTRGYQCTLNSGPELPSSATITFNWGTDDVLSGAVADIRVAQAPAITGTWNERSVSSASGTLASGNRVTVPGITLTGNEFFAFATATTAATMTYNTSKGFTPLISPVLRNTAPINNQIIAVQVFTNGSSTTPLNVTAMNFNTAGTTNVADLINAKVYYTTTSTFATTTQFGTAVLSPSGNIAFAGTQALALGANYFWLTYDLSATATVSDQLDAQITNITIDGGVGTVVPTVTSPPGTRTVYDNNYGGGAPFNANYYYANTLAGLPGNQQPTFSWIDNTLHTTVGDAGWKPNAPITASPGDDGYFGPVTLPFSYTFFGNTYTQMWIGTNGWITFTDPQFISQANMRAVSTIPTTGGLNNYIAGAMKDFDVTTATYADAKVTYDGNTDREVVTFFHAHSFASTVDWITYQIIIYPDGNCKIQYNFAETSGGGTPPVGITNSSVTGMENVDGTAGIQYRLNGVGGPLFGSDLALEFGLNANALPVELSAFTSNVTGNNAKLDWSTVSEHNNQGFNIERKSASDNNWTNVGYMNGAGSSNLAHSYSFTDSRLSSGRYNYRLKQIDFNGNFHYYDLSNEVVVGLPTKFALSQNYPNPFNPATKIDFELPVDGKITLKLYDITGREVALLYNDEIRTAGYYSAVFNGANFASGTYFYRLDVTGSKNFSMTKKMMLVK